MLMTRAIQASRDSLVRYSRASRLTGFAEELFAGISAIRAAGKAGRI